MPSSYTTNLGLEKPATGEQAGTWGTTANNSYDFLDAGIDGNVSIPLSASGYTLMTNQGTPSNGRNKVVIFTGALTADASITIAPNTAEKIYFILNQTTGGFNLVVSQGTGPNVKIAAGKSAVVYSNGGGGAAGCYGVLADFQCDSLLVTTLTATNLAFTGASTISGAANFTGGVTISPSLVLNLGGDQPGDTYYRNAAGQMTRLGIGSANQLLQVAGGVPQWATVSLAVNTGMPIGGAQANKVLFTDAAATLQTNVNFSWVTGVGLGIGIIAAQHPLHVGTGGFPAEAWFDDVSGKVKRVVFATNNTLRAYFGVNGVVESGGDAGSNPVIGSLNDAGSSGFVHFFAYRGNGHVSLGGLADLGGVVNIVSGGQATATPMLVVRSGSGGTGDLQDWQNPVGTNLAHIDYAGNMAVQGLTVGGSLSVAGSFSVGSLDTGRNGSVSSGGFNVYDAGVGSLHNGYTGPVMTPGGTVNCINGIIVRN
jgi:hypothetical protein